MRFTSLEDLGCIQRSSVQYTLSTTAKYFVHLAKVRWKYDAEHTTSTMQTPFHNLFSFARVCLLFMHGNCSPNRVLDNRIRSWKP